MIKKIEKSNNIINAKDIKKPKYPIKESFKSVLCDALIRHGVKNESNIPRH